MFFAAFTKTAALNPFLKSKYFSICIQVLRGKFSIHTQGLTDFHPYTALRNFMQKQLAFVEDHRPLG